MRRYGLVLAVAVAAGAVVVSAVARDRSPAQEKPPAQPDGPEAAVRKLGEEYLKAFNAGDAKAAAAAWTADGEYTGPDGETVRGRDALEKMYADTFRDRPKATAVVKDRTVRSIGARAAVGEGILVIRTPNDPKPGETRYSALLVREDDGWKIASVHEWEPDAALDVTPKDLEWMVGEWQAKGVGGEARITYSWDEAQAFLHGKYTLTRDGKTISSGTQVIGADPSGGLRSWQFDSSGTFGESAWERDGNRWLANVVGTLPDGSETEATTILIVLGPDEFTFQAVGRTLGGAELPDQPPVKVTRVKAQK